MRTVKKATFRSVRRACYAGLDSIALRAEVVRRLSGVVGYDAHSFATADPDTGLFTHVVAEGVPEPVEGGGGGPGVLVVDSRARVTLRSAAASFQLEDLADVGVELGELPYAVLSAIALLHDRQRRPSSPDAPEESALRVRGRSGRWYTLRASFAEPDRNGDTPVVVTIEPSAPREIAAILARLYGLSPREREIVALIARGDSTKAIAAKVGLSVYTVQEHLGNACEKVGVRGRKALLAKLFFDGYAPTLGG